MYSTNRTLFFVKIQDRIAMSYEKRWLIRKPVPLWGIIDHRIALSEEEIVALNSVSVFRGRMDYIPVVKPGRLI